LMGLISILRRPMSATLFARGRVRWRTDVAEVCRFLSARYTSQPITLGNPGFSHRPSSNGAVCTEAHDASAASSNSLDPSSNTGCGSRQIVSHSTGAEQSANQPRRRIGGKDDDDGAERGDGQERAEGVCHRTTLSAVAEVKKGTRIGEQ
jgi:hypothetical protein